MSDPLDQFFVKDLKEVINPEELRRLVELKQKIESVWKEGDLQRKERTKLLRQLPFKTQEQINQLRKSKREALERLKQQKREIMKNFKEEVAKLRVERRMLIKESKELNDNALYGKRIWEELQKLQNLQYDLETQLRKKYEDNLK